MKGTSAGRFGASRAKDADGGGRRFPAGGILIPFFSRSGRTRMVAGVIHELTGGSLCEIRGEKSYPSDYYETTAVARREKETGARPPVSGALPDLSGIGTVFLGYPNWWYDMPMVVYSFVEALDFSGRTVAPFCTSAGSGLSATVETITRMIPGATVLEGLALTDREVNGASVAVTEWLSRLGFARRD